MTDIHDFKTMVRGHLVRLSKLTVSHLSRLEALYWRTWNRIEPAWTKAQQERRDVDELGHALRTAIRMNLIRGVVEEILIRMSCEAVRQRLDLRSFPGGEMRSVNQEVRVIVNEREYLLVVDYLGNGRIVHFANESVTELRVSSTEAEIT